MEKRQKNRIILSYRYSDTQFRRKKVGSSQKKTRTYKLKASVIDPGFACRTVTIHMFLVIKMIVTNLQKNVNDDFDYCE